MTIGEMKNRIEYIEREIGELNEQIILLTDERLKWLIQMNMLKEEKNTDILLSQISNATEEKMFYCHLSKNARTTPIMDEFYHSDKEFLVVEDAFILANNLRRVSLVIVRNERDIKYQNDGLTMTNLKKIIGTFVTKYKLERHESRGRSLFTELIEIDQMEVHEGAMIKFQYPCLLGGQTFNDQKGFGNEYYGEEHVYQGKKYGDTTKFLIIGVKIGKGIYELL